jgi:hypothetical protein
MAEATPQKLVSNSVQKDTISEIFRKKKTFLEIKRNTPKKRSYVMMKEILPQPHQVSEHSRFVLIYEMK